MCVIRVKEDKLMDFEIIYRKYFKDVLLYVCGLAGDALLAEEIAQETFTKALKAIDSYNGDKDIRAWLFTIAKNSYFSYFRKQKQNVPLPEEDLAVEIRRVLEGRAPIEAEVQNMDRTDVDLDDYSREVLEPKKRRGCGCSLLVILLLVGAIGAVVYFLLPYLGRLTWINGL